MKILVACEESQNLTIELRKLGHEAYSCDILNCSGGRPDWHINHDVLPLLNGSCQFITQDGEQHSINGKWDMIFAFPPCTHLACSGAKYFKQKREQGVQQEAIEFFMQMINADCDRIVVENPIGIMSSVYRKPDIIFSPWQFNTDNDPLQNVNKHTCLWIKGDMKFTPTVLERPEIQYKEWVDKKSGKIKRQELWMYNIRCLPHKDRGIQQAKTFPCVAKAMAEQLTK